MITILTILATVLFCFSNFVFGFLLSTKVKRFFYIRKARSILKKREARLTNTLTPLVISSTVSKVLQGKYNDFLKNGFLIMSPSGVCFSNDFFSSVLKIKKESLKGFGWIDCIHPDDVLQMCEAMRHHTGVIVNRWRFGERFTMLSVAWCRDIDSNVDVVVLRDASQSELKNNSLMDAKEFGHQIRDELSGVQKLP